MSAIEINAVPSARPKSAMDRGYLATLDGWRAVAVSLVIGAHSVHMIEASGLPGSEAVASLFNHAGYGVDLFFALSGFLITTLLLNEQQKSGTIVLSAFYARRFFRIIPPMAVYMLAALMLIPIVSWVEVAYSFLFVRNYVDGSWYTTHFWSLSIEEHFYAVMPLLILLLRRNRLLIVSLVLIAFCVTIRWYEFTYLSPSLRVPQFRTENRVDALLWGSVLAQLVCRSVWHERFTRLLTPAIVVLLAAAAIAGLFTFESTPVRRTIVAFVLPLVIVSTVLRPASGLGQLLEWAPVRYVGRLSYSLYIWQMMFFAPGETQLGIAQQFPLALIFTLALAWLSYNLVEKPCIRLGHHLSRRLSARPMLDQSAGIAVAS